MQGESTFLSSLDTTIKQCIISNKDDAKMLNLILHLLANITYTSPWCAEKVCDDTTVFGILEYLIENTETLSLDTFEMLIFLTLGLSKIASTFDKREVTILAQLG